MKKLRWMIWLVVGGLVLAACQQTVTVPVPTDGTGPVPPPLPTEPPEPIPVTCDPKLTSAPATDRYRAWVLFREPEPKGFADDVSTLLRSGGESQVIIRADLVEPLVVAEAIDAIELIVPAEQAPVTVVVPVDAASEDDFKVALGTLIGMASDKSPAVLRATVHVPWPPHCSSTFVTGGEHELYPLEEYDPPGRHPNSPGANPWG